MAVEVEPLTDIGLKGVEVTLTEADRSRDRLAEGQRGLGLDHLDEFEGDEGVGIGVGPDGGQDIGAVGG